MELETGNLFISESDKGIDLKASPRGYSPLAHRMRPLCLDDFIGQEKVLGDGKPLRHWIETDQVPSIVLWGPPGCGKTTLAQIIAEKTNSTFISLSAVLSGVKDIKEAVETARHRHELHQKKTILFVDEIHRFNRSQQDALLPHVENGTVTLIGATTENPSFELNSALLSRARVVRLERLTSEALEVIIQNAIKDSSRGLGFSLRLSEEAVRWLAVSSEGDARRALGALEHASAYFKDKSKEISAEELQSALESALGRQPIPYDHAGEEHYNVISAFIKSIRSSDPHAGLYYLARMLEGGEDPLFIARRLVVLASEDVGNADPRALQVAMSVKDAVDFIGMPEARINLAQAVTYLASAPKSNASYVGLSSAMEEVHRSGALPVPMHLRNAVTNLMKNEGYGKGYQYAHDSAGAVVRQKHLPDAIVGRRFYRPTENGLEKQIKEKLQILEKGFE